MLTKRLCSLAASMAVAATVFAQSGFTYQGRLQEGGAPANGVYDLQFALFGTPAGGAELGLANRNDVAVQNGLFTTEIAGLAAQFNGQDRWLEVRVRPGASTGAYTTLGPRVAITRTPYAAYSFAPWVTNGSNLSYANGNVGIGVGDKFQVEGATGTVRFTDDLASIRFPATTAPNAPMMYLFASGDNNAERFVLGHSPTFPNWGLMFRDIDDSFHFRGGSEPGVSLHLHRGRVGIDRSNANFPLHFASKLGNKIALWGEAGAHYGIGVQDFTLQIYADQPASSIAFGTGSSTAFSEVMRVKGSGEVLIGTSTVEGKVTISAASGNGLIALSPTNGVFAGVYGFSTAFSGVGVIGQTVGNGASFGVWGRGAGGDSHAGYFTGRVAVTGSLSAGGLKAFKIDHPLDPGNKYLMHYSAESPEVLNIYRGTVRLDGSGGATVTLPDYFESVNRDVMVQLTAMGAAMPNLHTVEERVEGRTFTIAGGVPGKLVTWMVTAQRNDRFVQTHGAPVEVAKPAGLRGTYQDATLFGLPEEDSEAFRRGDADAEPKR